MKNFVINLFVLTSLLCSTRCFAQKKSSLYNETINPRIRVIIDNDFGGDPDGLFQLVHHILSPSVEIKGIIGSIHYKGGFYGYSGSAEYACETVNKLLEIMSVNGRYPVYKGADSALIDINTPVVSAGAKAIVKEAMRNDTKLPLYIVCGAGLTDIASAYLMEPAIAERIKLVWIGGPEYQDIAIPPPGYSKLEYNLGIDKKAAQVIFNVSDIPLWQVPRDSYRLALVSYTELLEKVKSKGPVGEFLVSRLESILKKSEKTLGETYVLGDSPLVLLTALQSTWEADPSSSKYVLKPAPRISDTGAYEINYSGRSIRVYNAIDTRLLFEDFFVKLNFFNSNVE